jgi:holin-like protein
MVAYLLMLLGFQLAGEAIVTACSLTFPGPLCGMLLLLGWLLMCGGPADGLGKTSDLLIEHLGLLFVPAGTAIIGFGAVLISDGLAMLAALVISTGLAILVSGLVYGSGADLPPGSAER